MKVTDLRPKELIHCKTVEECEAIQKLMHEAGLQWCSGESYKDLLKTERLNLGGQCYQPRTGSYSNYNWYQEEGGYTFYPASLFINHTTLTLDIAKQMYSSGIPSLKAFAIENYPELDDVRYSGYTIERIHDSLIATNKVCNKTFPSLIWTTKEMAEAVLSLSVLMQKCQALAKSTDNLGYYRTISKHISNNSGRLMVYHTAKPDLYPLVFFRQDVAEKFFEDNKELLDKAFILL